jgi:PAS domain-containing protein
VSSPAPDALAALRRRATATGDAALVGAIADVERAYQTLALERASLQSRLAASATNAERELAKLRTLGRVAETVNSSLELDVVLRSVLDTAVEVMQAERGFLMIADAAGKLELTTTYGIDRATVEGDDMRPSQTTVRRVFETGEPVVTTDAQQDPRFNVNLSVRALRLRSIICVPLAIKARTIGVVYLDSRIAPGLFSPHDPDLLTAFANQAALAIENARLFDDLRARVVEISRLEQLQARVLGSITSGVITIDGRGEIGSFNDAAATTFGVDGAAMIGKPARSLEALLPGITTLLAAGLAPSAPFEIEARHSTRGTLALELRTAPVDLPDGTETSGWAIALTDLTERRALERLHAADVEQRRAIRDAFGRYLAPHVVEQLMRAPGGVAPTSPASPDWPNGSTPKPSSTSSTSSLAPRCRSCSSTTACSTSSTATGSWSCSAHRASATTTRRAQLPSPPSSTAPARTSKPTANRCSSRSA